MHFLADESCDFAVVRALRAAGHDVVAIRDVRPGATDDAVFALALIEARVLLTEDKDFGRLVFAGAQRSPGVIFIRFPPVARQAMTHSVIQLAGKAAEKIAGRFVVVQPGRIRTTERPPDK